MTLSATLDLKEAGARLWDVIVVGAGPAGAVVAREMARRKASVLLVDKAIFPRWKVCGSCLNRWALSTLSAIGLGDLAGGLGAVPLSGCQLAAGRRQISLPLPGGAALSREVFDAALCKAAIQAGAEFLPGTQARLDDSTAQAHRLLLSSGGGEARAAAQLVLAADGLGGGLVAREASCRTVLAAGARFGAGAIAEEGPPYYRDGTIYMACGAGGYVGVVRLEDRRLNIGAAFDATWVKRAGGLGKAAAMIIDAAGFPEVPGLATLPWRGTPILTRRVSPLVFHRMFVLGDAAGYVEPFTGEGMAWALASAVALAPLAQRVCRRWDPAVAGQWPRLYRPNRGGPTMGVPDIGFCLAAPRPHESNDRNCWACARSGCAACPLFEHRVDNGSEKIRVFAQTTRQRSTKEPAKMITCDRVTKKDIRFHYDLTTLFYYLLWGRHIHHGLWDGAATTSQAQVQLIERLAAAASIHRCSSVLDVGCGMGGSSIHLARHLQCQVIGLTLSPVQRLWARVASWLGGVSEYNRFLCKDAETVCFAPGSFDVVWSVECTEHLFDKARFFRQVAGWLKPGGTVAICAWLAGEHMDVPADREQVHRVCCDFLCPSLGSADDYQSWMRQAGLEVLSCDDITDKVERTWEICLERTRRPGIRGIAWLAGPTMARFVQGFEGILQAYRSGAMRYGCIVARAPT